MWKQSMAVVFGLAVVGAASAGDDPLRAAYDRAMVDASVAEESELSDTLVAINADNPNLVWNDEKTRVLMVAWKSQGAYERFFKPYDAFSDNPEYPTFLTAAPELKTFCKQWTAAHVGGDLDMRLRQRLGLDPSWSYDVMIEFWVAPDDVFRPCVDPQADDSGCKLRFEGRNTPIVAGIPDYRSYYEWHYYRSFRNPGGAPWTGLGYTYDWGDADNEHGFSEFIGKPGAKYEIRGVIETAEYCM